MRGLVSLLHVADELLLPRELVPGVLRWKGWSPMRGLVSLPHVADELLFLREHFPAVNTRALLLTMITN